MKDIYTIGHSTDSLEKFVEYIEYENIDTVVDVRSVPYSKFVNQFNKDSLSAFLNIKKIFYIFLGNNLGARHTDKSLLNENGQVDFSKVMMTKQFKEGIDRLETGIKKGHRIVLMCSEKNPLECHRFSLISQYLHMKGYNIGHIVNHNVYEHSYLEDKLIEFYKEYDKITTNLNKLLSEQFLQDSLFNTNNIEPHVIYDQLNSIVAYQALEEISN